MFKKIIALCLGLILTFSSLGVVGAVPANAVIKTDLTFSDTSGHWSVQVVEEAAAIGLLSGYPDQTFKPEKFMTRLEALTVIIRAMGLEEETQQISVKDSDVQLPKGMSWGQEYVIMAIKEGLLNKDYSFTLKYNEPVTRAEVATLIAFSLGLKGDPAELSFSDTKLISSDYISYVAGIVKTGIMTGIGNNEFGPTQGMKRGQMAALLSRLAEESWYKNNITKVRKSVVTSFETKSGILQLKNSDNTDTAAVLNDNLAVFDASGKLVQIDAIQVGDSIYTAPYNDVLIKYVKILPQNAEGDRDLAAILVDLQNNNKNNANSGSIMPDNQVTNNNQMNDTASTDPNNNSNNTSMNNSNNQENNNSTEVTTEVTNNETPSTDQTEYYTSTKRIVLHGTILEVNPDKNRIKLQTDQGETYWFVLSGSCIFYDEINSSNSIKDLNGIEKNWEADIKVDNTLITEIAVLRK